MKKKVELIFQGIGKNEMSFESFAKQLIGESDFIGKPTLVNKLRYCYSEVDKDGSNSVDINEIKEWLE